MKWAEIAGTLSKEHLQFLSQYLNSKGLKNEVHFLEAKIDNFESVLGEAKKNFDQIRIGTPFREHVVQGMTHAPADILTLKAADCLIKQPNGSWWPFNLVHYAFLSEFTSKVKTLDLNSSIIMVGSGGASRGIIAALAKLGFQKFNIADRDEPRAKRMVADLEKSFFNTEFNYISQGSLMMLPGSNSALINTTPLVPSNDLLFDLYYFNFLKAPGVVIDLTMIPVKTPLLQEAENIGAKIVYGYEISAHMDILWASKVFSKELDVNKYSKALGEEMSKVPFDLSPFKNE